MPRAMNPIQRNPGTIGVTDPIRIGTPITARSGGYKGSMMRARRNMNRVSALRNRSRSASRR